MRTNRGQRATEPRPSVRRGLQSARSFWRAYTLLLLGATIAFAQTVLVIDTVAGSGTAGDGGPAKSAILRQPGGVAVDSSGNIYISDTGAHRIRKVARNGVILSLIHI